MLPQVRCYIHLCLDRIAALRVDQNRLAAILLDLKLTVQAAALAVVKFDVQLGIGEIAKPSAKKKYVSIDKKQAT